MVSGSLSGLEEAKKHSYPKKTNKKTNKEKKKKKFEITSFQLRLDRGRDRPL
jgi:hypothetical protein